MAPLSLLTVCVLCFGQETAPLPRIDRSGVRPVLLVDGRPFLVLGGQINNSSAWSVTLPTVWPVLDVMHANTLEAPVYWETLEPAQGNFDFTQTDALLTGAREHHKRLVLLWFGTWKNGSPSYVPEWIKRDPVRYPLARKTDGTLSFSLSPFGEATLAADSKAFAALMHHLKTADPEHTVIMVQVENETGMWGGMRDHSQAADQAFAAPVPGVILHSMGKDKARGNWSDVFGPDADEFFYAWSIARYVEQVAEAGRRELALPLYVNAALRDPLTLGPPLSFESGGPTYDVLPLWHAVAPILDGINPDIYMPEYSKVSAVLAQYALPWNAYFIPEIGNAVGYARFFFTVLGSGAFGFSPFGMDASGFSNYPLGSKTVDAESIAPFAQNNELAGAISQELAGWIQQGKVHGVAEDTATHVQKLDLSVPGSDKTHWSATISYGLPTFYSDKPASGNAAPSGEAMVVTLGQDEFLVAGFHCRVDFQPVGSAAGAQRMWVSVEEGTYVHGIWQRSRLWNGDQTDYGLNFIDRPQLLRVRLLTYDLPNEAGKPLHATTELH